MKRNRDGRATKVKAVKTPGKHAQKVTQKKADRELKKHPYSATQGVPGNDSTKARISVDSVMTAIETGTKVAGEVAGTVKDLAQGNGGSGGGGGGGSDEGGGGGSGGDSGGNGGGGGGEDKTFFQKYGLYIGVGVGFLLLVGGFLFFGNKK